LAPSWGTGVARDGKRGGMAPTEVVGCTIDGGQEAKGKIKEKAGQVTNDPNLKAEGQAENLAGKVQKKVGQVEKVLEK
jgi:uncharacterized protein YjbJ (UPF0337 family)